MMGCDEEIDGSSVTRVFEDCEELMALLTIVEAGRCPATNELVTCGEAELLFFLCCRDAREEEMDKDLAGCEGVLEGVADINSRSMQSYFYKQK